VEAQKVDVLPCTLVFLERERKGSPNHHSKNPFSYVRQSICLNKSLLRAGFPRLNIFTNDVDAVLAQLIEIPAAERPFIHELHVTMHVPQQALFYAAHFKLDLIAQAAEMLRAGELLLLLDTDMVALRSLDAEMLRRCATAGLGAFDISDQVFPAYGSKRVISDLQRVAGQRLKNPRWYGGEFLLATAAFLGQLVPRARQSYEHYLSAIACLEHQGDEVFISAALNALADEGQVIVEVGAYQAIGRHWAGNTHRDLRWFRGCCFVHLSGAKALFEAESRFRDFDVRRFWRKVSFAHHIKRLHFAAKLYLGR